MRVAKVDEIVEELMEKIDREIVGVRGGSVNTPCGFYRSGECVQIGNCPEDYFKCEWYGQ